MRQHVLEINLRAGSRSPSPGPQAPTHVQEQATLRKETISAFHTAVQDESGSDDEDDLLIPREKTKDEIEQEQEEYRRYLEQEVGENIGELVGIDRGPVDVDEESETEEGAGEELEEEKKKRRKRKKGGKTKEEKDHEFLMKCVFQISNLCLF